MRRRRDERARLPRRDELRRRLQASRACIICQNNHWAISVPDRAADGLARRSPSRAAPTASRRARRRQRRARRLPRRLRGRGARARAAAGPTFIEALTYRIGAHSTSDDPTRYRTEDEVERWMKQRPGRRASRATSCRSALLDDARETRARAGAQRRDRRRRHRGRGAAPARRARRSSTTSTPSCPWHLARAARRARAHAARARARRRPLSRSARSGQRLLACDARGSRPPLADRPSGVPMAKLMKTYDAMVIGGGPGGYACAIRLGQLKQKVALRREGGVGGVCLNWGCVPSKALIAASAHSTRRRRTTARRWASRPTASSVDVRTKMQDWKDGIVKKLTGGVRGLLQGQRRRARRWATRDVTGPKHGRGQDTDGGTETIEATKGIVIATGSSTIEIPTLQVRRQADHRRARGRRACARSRSACSSSAAASSASSSAWSTRSSARKLTVVEATAAAPPRRRSRLRRRSSRSSIVKHGGKILKNAKAIGYEKSADGSLAVKVELGDGKQRHDRRATCVLVAVGMRPNGEGPRPRGGRREGRRARLRPDRQARPHQRAGDLRHRRRERPADARAQGDEGGRGRRRGHRRPQGGEGLGRDPRRHLHRSGDRDRRPHRGEAKAKGIEVSVGKFPFAALGRAMAVDETEGFVKVVADKKTNELLGVHIVGPEASDLISEGALALEMRAFLEDVGAHDPPAPDAGRGDDGGRRARAGQRDPHRQSLARRCNTDQRIMGAAVTAVTAMSKRAGGCPLSLGSCLRRIPGGGRMRSLALSTKFLLGDRGFRGGDPARVQRRRGNSISRVAPGQRGPAARGARAETTGGPGSVEHHWSASDRAGPHPGHLPDVRQLTVSRRLGHSGRLRGDGHRGSAVNAAWIVDTRHRGREREGIVLATGKQGGDIISRASFKGRWAR